MEKEQRDSLRKFIMWLEDPYPKRAKVIPNKPHKIKRLLRHIMEIINSFFYDIWLASKELIKLSL